MCENINPITQCTDMQIAIALALIRLGNISERRRPGTGPAPKENVKTKLHEMKKGIVRSLCESYMEKINMAT